ADRLRPADHLLRRTPRSPLLPAGSAPELVLRRASHMGEAEGRPRDDDGLTAPGAAREARAGAGCVVAEGAPGAARAAGAGRARRAGRRGRRGDLLGT